MLFLLTLYLIQLLVGAYFWSYFICLVSFFCINALKYISISPHRPLTKFGYFLFPFICNLVFYWFSLHGSIFWLTFIDHWGLYEFTACVLLILILIYFCDFFICKEFFFYGSDSLSLISNNPFPFLYGLAITEWALAFLYINVISHNG